MGVPVVTLVGNLHASRVGLSLLSAIGLKDLAADTADEFIRIAASLAGDSRRLHQLRTGLRHTMTASPLCDRTAFAARFGAALRQMWMSYCSAPR
jgi:predicted O-linked N-acetylglucosamine transferase (SPINDLY family)